MNLRSIFDIFNTLRNKNSVDLSAITNFNYEEKCKNTIYPKDERELEGYYVVSVKNVFEERKILEDIKKISNRCYKLEKEIQDKYSQKFEETFALVDLSFEYIPLYQINDDEDEDSLKLFNENESALGFYSLQDEVGVLRKNVDEKLENIVAVHETVHHNLKLLCKDKRIERKSRFIEEGFTEFLTEFITGEEYIREEESKDPDSIFPYMMGSNIFEQIYESMGLENAFKFYKRSDTCEDLLRIAYRGGTIEISISNKK